MLKLKTKQKTLARDYYGKSRLNKNIDLYHFSSINELENQSKLG